jgi:ribosome-associated toxin RatA of RatAB toxin-antitoxin module
MPRRLPHIAALLLLTGLAIAARALTDDEVTVDYRDGTYYGSLRLRTPASPAVVMAVLTDFESMPEFMPGLTSSRIVARHHNQYQIAQQGKISFGPFSMPFESLRQIEVVDGRRILSKSLSGSARRMQSVMQVRPLEVGSEIDYRIEIEPANWLPSSLGSNFLQHELAEQFNALSREMVRRQ